MANSCDLAYMDYHLQLLDLLTSRHDHCPPPLESVLQPVLVTWLGQIQAQVQGRGFHLHHS